MRVAEVRHEKSGGLCGAETADEIADEIAGESETCFANLEMLRIFVYELDGLSARERRRRVVALRPFLERAEACVSVYLLPPQLLFWRKSSWPFCDVAGGQQPDLATVG